MVAFLFFIVGENSVHYSDIVWSNDIFVCFPFASDLWSKIFLFLFASLQSLIGNFVFFFCSSKHLHNLTVNETSFWERILFFLSRARVKAPIPGQGLWSKDWGFGSNGLAKGWTWHMSGYLFGKRFKDKENALHLFPWHAYNNDDLEIYAKLIMHAPIRTLKYQVLWPCNTKA